MLPTLLCALLGRLLPGALPGSAQLLATLALLAAPVRLVLEVWEAA
jgi:hypothetical protein